MPAPKEEKIGVETSKTFGSPIIRLAERIDRLRDLQRRIMKTDEDIETLLISIECTAGGLRHLAILMREELGKEKS